MSRELDQNADARLDMVENRTPSRVTLADFVEDNHKLLTVFGVFVAITTFANNLPSNRIGMNCAPKTGHKNGVS